MAGKDDIVRMCRVMGKTGWSRVSGKRRKVGEEDFWGARRNEEGR